MEQVDDRVDSRGDLLLVSASMCQLLRSLEEVFRQRPGYRREWLSRGEIVILLAPVQAHLLGANVMSRLGAGWVNREDLIKIPY